MMADLSGGSPPLISDGTLSPQNLQEFEALITRFYQPGNVELVSSIEKHLQWHQRSAQGWDMAFALLQSDSVNSRFFGALTLTVKLNTSGVHLDEEETLALSQRLLKLYIERHADVPMVAQKLSSALAVFYMLPEASANACIRTLGAAFASPSKDGVNDGQTSMDVPLKESLHHLDGVKLLGLLKFVDSLAEEGNKRLVDAGADRKLAAVYQDRVQVNIYDAAEVMRFLLEPSRANQPIRARAAGCFATWASFCQKAVGVDLEQITHLRTLIRPTLILASEDYDDLVADVQPPLDTMADLLSSYPAFFKDNHLKDVSELLRSSNGQQYIEKLKGGDDTATPFQRLLCAYVDADLARIVEAYDDPAMAHIMSMMHELLHCNGHAAVEDNVIVEMCSIWNTVVEYIVDTSYDTSTKPAPAWHGAAKSQIVRMVEEFWAKIQYPPPDEYRGWGEDDKKAFQQFRTDVRDLINTCHLALGTELLRAFVHMSLRALEQQHWTQLEAALYCLYGIAESLDESDEEEDITAQLMNSRLYPDLSNHDPAIPLHVRRTAMRLIGNLGSYFERHPESLPNALHYLFTSLAVASLADPASRSIHSLCTTCRDSLVPQLDEFFALYEQFLSWPTTSTFTKSNVIGAVAAVAQTLPRDALKAQALTRLLDFVEADVRSSLEYMAGGDADRSAATGNCAMKCLSAIAKSFQETVEVVDLDSPSQAQSYWTLDGDGHAVQQRIVRLISTTLEILAFDFEILDSICETLKAGFKETSPGPFVIQPSIVIGILTRPQADSQHVCLVLSTACSFLRSYTPTTTLSIKTEAHTLLEHLTNLMQQLGDPRNDPEVSQAIIEVLTRYMPRYTTTLIQTNPEPSFTFTMRCIAAPEPLPKRAAAAFWSAVLGLTSQPQPLQSLLDQVVEHFGPALARVLVAEVARNSMRSDLETLADPLKKLWSRHPRARSWLEAALSVAPEDALQSGDAGLQMLAAVGAQVKYRFLEQLRVAKDLGTVRKAMQELGAGCKAAVRGR